MKQPELGKKISELRKVKGLTQEELVEKCNISVRTIQRIESGEVTPRIYTVKTILAALDYDLKEITDKESNIFDLFIMWLKKILLIDIDMNQPSSFLIKQLNRAWILGIIYFILTFFEGTAEYYRYMEYTMIFSINTYIIMKVIVFIAFFYFQRGFILIGGLFKNYLLKIISFILIFSELIVKIYDVGSIFYDSIESEYIGGGISLTYGAIGIIYGISLNRLRKPVGILAKYAGIFEILAACFFLTIIFSFIGFFILIPAGLFEIILIYKTIEIIKTKQQESIE